MVGQELDGRRALRPRGAAAVGGHRHATRFHPTEISCGAVFEGNGGRRWCDDRCGVALTLTSVKNDKNVAVISTRSSSSLVRARACAGDARGQCSGGNRRTSICGPRAPRPPAPGCRRERTADSASGPREEVNRTPPRRRAARRPASCPCCRPPLVAPHES